MVLYNCFINPFRNFLQCILITLILASPRATSSQASFFGLMISERKFHHGRPGTASRVAVSAAIMVAQAGKVRQGACPQSSLLD